MQVINDMIGTGGALNGVATICALSVGLLLSVILITTIPLGAVRSRAD